MSILHRIAPVLLACLSATTTACDPAEPSFGGPEVDRAHAELVLGASPVHAAGEDPLAEVADDRLFIDVPTVRDVAEGRVQPPMIASSFALEGEECPQRLAAREGRDVSRPEVEEVTVESVDPAVLDLPLTQACLRRDLKSGHHTLIACDGHIDTDGALRGGDGYDVITLAPAGVHGSTYDPHYPCSFCTDGFPCYTRRYQEGYLNQYYQCVSWGYQGCC